MDEMGSDGSFGIAQLDNISLGKIQPGMIGLFHGPCGTGKSSILSHFLLQGAREDGNVCLITSEPPSIVASRISQFEGYDPKWLKDGYITILNIYDLMDIIGVRLCSLEVGDQDLIYDLLIQVIDHLDIKRMVIDPVNPLLNALDKEMTGSFFQGLKNELLNRNATCFISFDTNKDKEEWENNALSLFDLDIVVKFDKEIGQPIIFNTMLIERWRSAQHT